MCRFNKFFSFPFVYLDSTCCVKDFPQMCGNSCPYIYCEEEGFNNLAGSPVLICEDVQVVVIGLEPSHGASEIY